MRDDIAGGAPTGRPRFLSKADCQDIAQRLARYAVGGGDIAVGVTSIWRGNVRWARNRVSTTGEDRDNNIIVQRYLHGAFGTILLNAVTDEALMAATRQAERLAELHKQNLDTDILTRPDSPFHYQDEPFTAPQLFSESTYQLDAKARAEAARQLARSAADAGMLSAGYVQVSAMSKAYITSWGYERYYQYTWAQYSVTVRDPKGVGSGWAGVDEPDWSKIDGEKLSAVALEKCLKSRNPVAVEPGRYTTILEPQAVCDFIGQMMFNGMGREGNETSAGAPFHKSGRSEPPHPLGGLGLSLLGEKVVDERITISADPMDPELGFPPYRQMFGLDIDVYHPATWIERGVLTNLAYNRRYARTLLGHDTGLPNSGAFRMSVTGPMTSVDDMITSTKRGFLVTRFDRVQGPSSAALLCRGYTRDGLWLIENGKISKPVKNLLFVESILFALNNVDQLGTPQRVFHPLPSDTLNTMFGHPQPVIVPPLKIRDFSFTALSDAI